MRLVAFSVLLVSCGSGEDSESSADADADADSDGEGSEAARSLCVEIVNEYRATLELAPYARWTDGESCADGEARSDSETGVPHGAFPRCEELAQNECPGWPGPVEAMLEGCLAGMWAEGPGEDFETHGHYINMSSTAYSEVACGFHTAAGGAMWSVQNFR